MMNSMSCTQLEQALEEQLEGVPSDSASAHLQTCARCRLLWKDLEAIRTAAQEWGADEPEPPARIWTSLRAQLDSEGLIREARRPGWLTGWLAGAPRLTLAGAYLSLLLIGAVLVNVRMDPLSPAASRHVRPVLSARLTSAESDLGDTLDSDMKRVMAALPEHNPSLVTSLQLNLGIVDNMIAVCEKSVREQPDDPVARQYLYGAFQQKAVLLATAIDRSTLEDQ